MKTVIMAGGLGKRVASIDPSIPKPLIPIAGKPVLLWEIECMVRQGYTDITLTVSHMAEKIQNYFGDGSQYGCSISYFMEESPLGNAGALFKLWESGALKENTDFLLLNADSMLDIDFHRFVTYHQEHNALATLFTHPNNHPYDSGLIITADNGVVHQWLTKEDDRPQWYRNCVNAGVHILNTDIFKFSGIKPSEVGTGEGQRKVDLDRDILKPVVSTKRIYSYSSPEYVKDMGTPERFEQVQKDICSGIMQSRNLNNQQRAIFLDRDGTINKNVGFLRDIDQFELLPGAAEAIRRINESGYLAIVVTNQPVIARGEVTVDELNTIHNKMETLLGEQGAYLDAIYYCPHHPDKGYLGEIPELKFDCECRKPKPGMLLKAAKDLNIDLKQSWMIGDTERDIQTGKSAGCSTILISDGGKMFGQTLVAESLYGAIQLLMETVILCQ